MNAGILSAPIFHDAEKAREWLEARLWKDGPICPKCGTVNEATLMKGKTTRPGLYQCNACREPFTVTVNTLYERSKVPLNKWLAATHLLMASKKGMSALQVGRMIGVSKKTAWFLCHRIRESVKFSGLAPMGGEGAIVEADETYYGPVKNRIPSPDRRGRPFTKGGKVGVGGKRAIVSLVQRGGDVRSFHVPRADAVTVAKIVNDNIAKESKLFTDESKLYTKVGANFAEHSTVVHSKKEYVRGEVHSNTVENYFSVFKRGMRGVYQHCDEKHLHRYLAEFDFRYNNREGKGFDDAMRFERSIPGIVGKRLTYQDTRKTVA
ncbi:MAG TPA: IS1595 family transposase [Rhizomicrobium sp.]|jgi:transposase-like protein|nr:IS1595 family transposase [Rhizomicrobium sp.]